MSAQKRRTLTGTGPASSGDAAIFRRLAADAAADRRRMSYWAAAIRGTAIVTRWRSEALLTQSAEATARARMLVEQAARLRQGGE